MVKQEAVTKSEGTKERKHYGVIWGFCLLLSLLYLLICTKSSPLYPFNDWVDANSFLTMGKGMMNGKVLYRDLFEQKGPLLYFIHGIAYLISNKTFFGVFVFEVISFTVFLFYSHKLITLFLDTKYSIISLPIITAIILNMRNFHFGDSAEEFCLPFMAVSLYYLINYFKNSYPEPVKYMPVLINGIMAGCVLWIKFSLLGFWFGWMASMFFCSILNKHYIKAIKSCFVYLAGMLLATIPWLIYFGINHSIFDWLDTYLLINLKYYPNIMTLFEKTIFIFRNVIYYTVKDWYFGIFCTVGVLGFILSKRYLKTVISRICFTLCGLFLAISVYGGGRGYVYYFFIFSPFAIFGFIVIFDFLNRKLNKEISLKTSFIAGILSVIISLPLTLAFNQNTYMLKINKNDLVQYQFAAVINQTENATLLNYGFIDMGFYTTTGITPNVRFFSKQNIYYPLFPLNLDEQNRYIKEKEVEYVVLRQKVPSDSVTAQIPYLYSNYKLIQKKKQIIEGELYDFLLFKEIT